MIFVTVGTQLGFDRLVKAMDHLAPTLGMPVIAQTGRGIYKPTNMDAFAMIEASRFEDLTKNAQLMVSHAGIGTLIAASQYCKPIVILPRKASLGEHRNDHQLATANLFCKRPNVLVAYDEEEVPGLVREGLNIDPEPKTTTSNSANLEKAVAGVISEWI